MMDQTSSAKPTLNASHKTRPTIGFVIMWGVDTDYSNYVWSGIMDAARDFDVNVISFAGRKGLELGNANFSPAIFEQINPSTLDGLVTILCDLKTIQLLKKVMAHCPLLRSACQMMNCPV